jgi:hypothetical protein
MKQQQPNDPIVQAAFSGDAKFSNEASITTDADGLHRIAFLEVGPDGAPHFRCAVLVKSNMLERLGEIFAERVNFKPGIIKPEHFKAH